MNEHDADKEFYLYRCVMLTCRERVQSPIQSLAKDHEVAAGYNLDVF